MDEISVTDIHIHVVPGIDDGAVNQQMALAMLKIAAEQGVRKVFCTSHDWETVEEREQYLQAYHALQRAASESGIPIELFTGNEIYCDMTTAPSAIRRLNEKTIFPLNNTKYVLTEFDPWVDAVEMKEICGCFLQSGWYPVIAHAERYFDITAGTIEDLVDAGCLVQVNAYSLQEESNETIREEARILLDNGMVHFIGSDAHRTTHRSPKISTGKEYIRENTTDEKYHKILSENAESYLF